MSHFIALPRIPKPLERWQQQEFDLVGGRHLVDQAWASGLSVLRLQTAFEWTYLPGQ